jgi:hypothetical protein
MDFQVRNFYPYPLAYPYRTLSGFTVPSDLYREQLRLAEGILAFLASIALALVKQEDRSKCGIDLAQYARPGISPGHWKELSQKATRPFDTYTNNRLAQSLHFLWHDRSKRKFRERIDRLIEAKNDFKHDRGPKTDEEVEKAAENLATTLAECLADLAFFTEHPIRLVRDLTGVRNSPLVSVRTLRCMGDHPGFKQEELTYPLPLMKNDLYIEVGTDDWIPLYPFLVPRNCPQCKTREIYFVDKWQGKGAAAILKSFERGHTEEEAGVGQALADWQANSARAAR